MICLNSSQGLAKTASWPAHRTAGVPARFGSGVSKMFASTPVTQGPRDRLQIVPPHPCPPPRGEGATVRGTGL